MPPAPTFPRLPRFSLTLLLAALIGAAGLAISFYHGPDGRAAVPNLDALLFQQYARAMAEGHPYRFNAADPPSTGSTSHLFPALLAVLYRAGLRGDALTTANLFLNFAAWLGALALIHAIARRLDRRAAPLAVLLCALSGQTFISFFLINDIGLFTVLALGAFAAALYGRTAWLGAALALASLCRPEGLILSGMLVLIVLVSHNRNRNPNRLMAGIAGLIAFAGVFALNRALTGRFQFQSVHHKSVFAAAGLAGGLHQFTTTLGEFIIQGLFNLNHPTRMFYAFPILGGLLGLLGIASRFRKVSLGVPPSGGIPPEGGTPKQIELWFILSALACSALIASSGWSGIQYDKYWAWFLPVWTLYIAIGLSALTTRFSSRISHSAFRILLVLIIGWQAAGLGHFIAAYSQDCALIAPIIGFTKKVQEILPAGASVGCRGASGLAYYLEGHPVYNVDGICAPQYLPPEDPVQALDLLRHRRDLRFDAWLLSGPDTEQWFKPLIGAQVAAAPPVFGGHIAFTLHKAVWSALEATTLPLSLPSISSIPTDSLDVGYGPDEARCGYDVFTRVPGARIGLFATYGTLGRRTLGDVGRVIIGAETFRMRVTPKRPARLVLRGALAAEAPVLTPPDGKPKSQNFEFVAPLKLNVFVDDRPAGQWVVAPPESKETFFEAAFDLPASALASENPMITIGGDHISLGYWIYQ